MYQWALDTYDINNSNAIAHVGEDYMLSKAFSGAMQPTRVIPFYFKASFTDEDDDDSHEDDDDGWQGSPSSDSAPIEHPPVKLDPSIVTITTLITPDRYGVFLRLVRQYRGPISVATHIRKGEDQDAMFHELNAFFQEHAVLRRYVDLHVIVDGVDFQLNMWRNVARMFARTDYFMMLDVDFHIPSGFKSHLHHDPRIQELLSAGVAIVIPAFEYALDHDPKDSKYFPDTKADLIPLLEKKHIRVFHDSFPPGHAATDTPRWIKMSKRALDTEQRRWGSVPKGGAGSEEVYGVEDDVGQISEEEREEYLKQEADGERPYKVTNFEPKYEPYIVLKREGTPWCDERFVGYGANKAACLFEIYISGIDFWVMPQDFLIHQYHDYPTTNRKNGRIINKQLFVQFQQEICFATLRRMIATGEWYTAKADNLRHQCGEFENFLKSADQLAQDYEERHPNSLLEEPVFVTDEDEQKRKESSREALVLAGQGKDGGAGNDGDRYESQGHNKAGLGGQIVDDEEHRDPFMSRPKGKVWGGIQPRTYYVPPPSVLEEEDIPIGGIDIDAAVDGTAEGDAVVDGYKEKGEYDKVEDNDLTDARLEQFRQGIILPDGHDRDRFAFRKEEWDSQRDGLHGDKSDNSGNKNHGGGEDGARAGDRYAEEGSDDLGQGEDLDVARKSHQPPPAAGRLSGHGQEHGGGSFAEAAEQLEEKFRLLRATV
ncbi:hypothetical protein EDD21DRAFT_358793 [Dissophora ornata]|nr:hypothetical protein EDD21DRAFT_358793 [Dissophora ornata]